MSTTTFGVRRRLLGLCLLACVTLTACEYPTAPVHDNPRDPENPAFMPTPASFLHVVHADTNVAKINWSNSSKYADEVVVWRQKGQGALEQIKRVPIDHPLVDTVYEDGTYTYAVAPARGSQVGGKVTSNQIILGSGLLAPPSGVNVFDEGAGKYTLRWSNQAKEGAHEATEVWRHLEGGASRMLGRVSPTVVQYADSTTAAGTYRYELRAAGIGRVGKSVFSSWFDVGMWVGLQGVTWRSHALVGGNRVVYGDRKGFWTASPVTGRSTWHTLPYHQYDCASPATPSAMVLVPVQDHDFLAFDEHCAVRIDGRTLQTELIGAHPLPYDAFEDVYEPLEHLRQATVAFDDGDVLFFFLTSRDRMKTIYYDRQAGTFEEANHDLPFPLRFASRLSAVASGTQVRLLAMQSNNTTVALEYDLNTQQFVEGAAVPASVGYRSKVFTNGATATVVTATTVEAYDADAGIWTTLADTPVYFAGEVFELADGRLIGFDGGADGEKAYTYLFERGSGWRTLEARPWKTGEVRSVFMLDGKYVVALGDLGARLLRE